MNWRKTIIGNHYLTLEEGKYRYEAVIGKLQPAAYDLTITFGIGKKCNDFYSRAYCKTISQAKQLEAQIRLTLMETYL